MVSRQESETRLAELIWRSVKLRVGLLALCVIALLVVWSALINGNEEARKIDDKFCAYLLTQNNEMQTSLAASAHAATPSVNLQPLIIDPRSTCVSPTSRIWIESTRYNDETYPLDRPIVPGSSTGLPDDVVQIVKNERQAFSAYDSERRSAYRLQIHLSSEYSSGSVELNALSVAELLPFCILLILTIYFVLGFQETAYRTHLRSLLEIKPADEGGSKLSVASTQFFVGPSLTDHSSLARYFVVSPDRLATLTLLVVVFVLLFKVISVFIFNLIHLTDTIFESYPFALYAAAFAVICVLMFTRQAYFASDPAHGRPPFARGLVFLRQLPTRLLVNLEHGWPRLFRWTPAGLAIVGFISLVLPWAYSSDGDLYAGLEFILNQSPEVLPGTAGFQWYDINPRVFSEMRLHLVVALLLLLTCGLYCGFFRSSGKVARILRKTLTSLAYLAIFLSLDFVMYLGILQYQSDTPSSWPMDLMPLQGTSIGRGKPMVFYNPTFVFWVFFACCLVSAWFALSSKRNRRPDRGLAQPFRD